jgi:hypothetical protein
MERASFERGYFLLIAKDSRDVRLNFPASSQIQKIGKLIFSS